GSSRTRSPISATIESQLATMAKEAQAATGGRDLTAIADRGCFKGEEIVACEAAGVTPIVPKPLTAGAKADGRFGRQDFVCDPGEAHPTPDRRTSVWNHQGLDGRDPLPPAHPRKGQNRDEPSRSRLQPEADDRHPRGAADDPGDEGRLRPSAYKI